MGIERFGLFIFDWDGTLSTSTTLVRLSRLFQSRYNPDEVSRHKEKYMVANMKNTKKVGEYIRENEAEARFYSSFYTAYSIFSRPKLREDVRETLDLLRKHGKRLAVFSDSRYIRLKKELEHARIYKHFDVVMCADLIKEYKPNPKGILLIAKELGFKTKECVYVGDMATDVMTARFGHMQSCAVGGGMDPYAVLKKAKPDYLFRNTAELYKSIRLRMSRQQNQSKK